jgi:hypothetical protein
MCRCSSIFHIIRPARTTIIGHGTMTDISTQSVTILVAMAAPASPLLKMSQALPQLAAQSRNHLLQFGPDGQLCRWHGTSCQQQLPCGTARFRHRSMAHIAGMPLSMSTAFVLYAPENNRCCLLAKHSTMRRALAASKKGVAAATHRFNLQRHADPTYACHVSHARRSNPPERAATRRASHLIQRSALAGCTS